jgi:hypothetical protein
MAGGFATRLQFNQEGRRVAVVLVRAFCFLLANVPIQLGSQRLPSLISQRFDAILPVHLAENLPHFRGCCN